MKLINGLLLTLFLFSLALSTTACRYSKTDISEAFITAEQVAYIPLDNRPVNYQNVIQLSKAAGFNPVYPRAEQLESHHELAQWLKTTGSAPKTVVLAADMLLYGGLVESRKHQLDDAVLYSRLDLIKEFNTGKQVLAFISIMRTPAANTLHTMPGYYATYGAHIFKYGMLQDKLNCGAGEPGDEEHIKKLAETIPWEYLADYTARREKNHRVTGELLKLVEQGFIDYLVISSDDTSPYGFSRAEKEKLVSLARRLNISDKVAFSPGTDECGMLLMSAASNRIYHQTPAVFVEYAQPASAGLVQPYEDIPLDENIRRHVTATGALPAENAAEADIILAVNNATEGEGTAGTGQSGYTQFIKQIDNHLKAGRPVTVADIKYANGADPDFMSELNQAVDLSLLAGYSGWNTAGNSIGLALSQGLIYHNAGEAKTPGLKELQRRALLTGLIEDWGYQAVTRPAVKQLVPPGQQQLFTDPGLEEEITALIEEKLNDFARSNLADFGPVELPGVKLPWHRLFDIEFEVR